MESLKKQIKNLNAEDFENLLGWAVTAERDRRRALEAKERVRVELVAELVEQGKVTGAKFISQEAALSGEKPPSWADPRGDVTKMFPHGAVVARKRRTYISNMEDRLNPFEPGGDDTPENAWSDITDLLKESREQIDKNESEAENTTGETGQEKAENAEEEPSGEGAPKIQETEDVSGVESEEATG